MNEKQRELEKKAWKLLKKQNLGAYILYPEKRERKGCDYCKKKHVATEEFIGFRNTVLWICQKCQNKLKKW